MSADILATASALDKKGEATSTGGVQTPEIAVLRQQVEDAGLRSSLVQNRIESIKAGLTSEVNDVTYCKLNFCFRLGKAFTTRILRCLPKE
jgi:hypothetical protein